MIRLLKTLSIVFVYSLLAAGCSSHYSSRQLIYPKALQPGDTIAVVAPASELSQERVERAQSRLEAMGFKVFIPKNLYRKRGYLAGSDEQRAEELMAAFRNPEIKAIYPGTGGYGTTRMLDLLDYKTIRQNPKILHGFSDITGLHLAIHKKAGLVTFHGPNLMYGLGSEDNLTWFSANYQWSAEVQSRFEMPRQIGYTFKMPADATPIRIIHPGVARGRLIGGNLSLISPLIGTEYEIETKGRILFIEDVREEPYRIDRYLSHLRLAGKLDQVAGVILGIFRKCESEDPEESLSLDQVFDDYFADLGVPVIQNFPVGHFKYNATLPIGVMAELDANTGTVKLLENPVDLSGVK